MLGIRFIFNQAGQRRRKGILNGTICTIKSSTTARILTVDRLPQYRNGGRVINSKTIAPLKSALFQNLVQTII